MTDDQVWRQSGKLLGGAVFRTSRRLGPTGKHVIVTQAFAASAIDRTSLVQAHDGVHLLMQKEAKGKERTEASISKNNIAWSQEVPERAEELTFVDAKVAAGKIEQRSAG